MIQYTIKKSTIPLMQKKQRPRWQVIGSWGLVGLLALGLAGYGLQHIS